MQGGQGLVDLGLGGVGVALHGLGSGQSVLEGVPALGGVVLLLESLGHVNGGLELGLVHGSQLDHHEGVTGHADHGSGSISHGGGGLHSHVVGVVQSVLVGDALRGQGLDDHFTAGEIGVGNIQAHLAVSFTVHIHQGDVDVACIVLAGQGGQRSDTVGHGGGGIQLGGYDLVAEAGVEHLEDVGGGGGEELELALTGGGVGALLGHYLDDSLLGGAQGVRSGAVPVGQTVLLNVGAAQFHILHHHLGNIQGMGLGANLGLGVTEDAELTDDRHLALRQHVHIVLDMIDAHIFGLLHGVIIEGFGVGTTGHGAGVGVDGHAVVPLVGTQVVHAGDKALGFIAGVHVGHIVGAFGGVDLCGGVFNGLGHVNEALALHGVGGVDVLTLGGDHAVDTITELDGAVGVVDHTVLVGGGGVFQRGYHRPLGEIAVGAHIDLHTVVHGLEAGVVHDVAVLVQHTGVQVGVAQEAHLVGSAVGLGGHLVPVLLQHGVLLREGGGAALGVGFFRPTGDVVGPVALGSGAVSGLAVGLLHLVANLKIAYIVGLLVAVGCTHGGPVNAAIGVGTHLSIEVLHQIGGVLGIAPAQAVYIHDLGVHLVGKVCDLTNAEVGSNTALVGVVVETVDLILAIFHRAQGRLPVEQVGDGTAGVTDGAKACLLVQLDELLLHLHGLRVKGAIAVEGVAVVDTEDGVGVNDLIHLTQIYVQMQGNDRVVVGDGLLQGGVCLLHLSQRLGFFSCINGLGQLHSVLVSIFQLMAVIQSFGLLNESIQINLVQGSGLILVDGLGFRIGEYLVVDVEFIHIATHGVGVILTRCLMGSQAQVQKLINGTVAQGLLAVQLTVDVEFHLLGVLVKGDSDVLPATLRHAARGDDIGAVDVGVIRSIGAQGEDRTTGSFVLQQHGGGSGYVTGDGGVVAVPHREGG